MPRYQAKANTKSWNSYEVNAPIQHTIQTQSTSCTALTQISSCWASQPTKLISLFYGKTSSSKTIKRDVASVVKKAIMQQNVPANLKKSLVNSTKRLVLRQKNRLFFCMLRF